ncbi:MAG: ABC transporter substrate-binding protein [Candidatus Faecousia sp.]|nr:ABC transporter substrate-binding protein [Candidatus Faecousia sp.]
MKKRIVAFLLGMLLCFGSGTAVGEAQGKLLCFEDDLGRRVTVEQAPQRVAVLIGSFAHMWYLAGGLDTMVATASDAWTGFDIPLPDDVINLGSTKQVSLEAVIAAEPDFVIASVNTDADLALREPLEAMGIPTAYFQVSTFGDYLHMLDILTQITGCRENYERFGLGVQAQVDEAKERADGSEPTVLYIRVSGSGCRVKNSDNSVLGEMLKDLGAVNIADSQDSLLENLSMEEILRQDPDYIFVVLQSSDPTVAQGVLEKTLLSDPAWDCLTAVAEGRFFLMDPALYNLKPNDRWGEAYEKLAEILYPRA